MRTLMLVPTLLMLLLLLAACSNSPAGADDTEGNSLGSNEQLAMNYVQQFLNEPSEEARAAYVKEHVHEEYQPLYTTETQMPDGPIKALPLSNPQVYKSITDVQSVANGVAVWLKGDSGKEVIVLIIEGKTALGFDNYSGSMLSIAGFEPLKREFE